MVIEPINIKAPRNYNILGELFYITKLSLQYIFTSTNANKEHPLSLGYEYWTGSKMSTQNNRMLYIDNLRILLITLVIMQHLSVTYGGSGSWYYHDPGQADMLSSSLLTIHNAINQSFFMGFLFLISGYFLPASYDRKGPRRFLKDRLLRLGIPLLFFDWIIQPLIVYQLFVEGTFRQFLREYYTQPHIGTGPLWFIETLLIFAFIYTLWRTLTKRAAPSIRNDKLPGNLLIFLFALFMGIVSFIVRLWLPVGWSLGLLNLQLPFFTQYICLFIVGIIAYRRNWLTSIPATRGRFWLYIAIVMVFVLFPAMFVLGGAHTGEVSEFLGGVNWQTLAYAIWEQIAGVAIIISLLFLFRAHLNKQGKILQAMSSGAYTTYIIHTPMIILLAYAIRNIRLYPLLKFPLSVLISVPLCFALAHIIRKLPLAKRIL